MILVGTAGWSIPRACAEVFPETGSHLERYAQRLAVVEIDTSFYRHHRPETYARWADTVPPHFRFAVKVPRAVTHEARLAGNDDVLQRFFGEVERLGPKLGGILVQLPPSLRYDEAVARGFFRRLRDLYDGSAWIEPRHKTWFEPEATHALAPFRLGRVAADPAVVPAAAVPAGDPEDVYVRLHGSPQMYSSNYDDASIAAYARALETYAASPQTRSCWCIFDNTALGAALPNALQLLRLLAPKRTTRSEGSFSAPLS